MWSPLTCAGAALRRQLTQHAGVGVRGVEASLQNGTNTDGIVHKWLTGNCT